VPQAESGEARTTVAPSGIAGRGLFATIPIVAGEVVVEFVSAPFDVHSLGPVNHSCDPTLVWDDGRLLVTARDVAAGEELTSDYSTHLDDEDFVLRCHCPSTRCRQMVTGQDWRIPELQRRYAGHWSAGLRRRIGKAAG
jgi:SET domain